MKEVLSIFLNISEKFLRLTALLRVPRWLLLHTSFPLMCLSVWTRLHFLWGSPPGSHWKRPWCWERLRAGGEGVDRGWEGGMASSTQWTWVCANSERWWRTEKPGVLRSMESQRVRHYWATEQTQSGTSTLFHAPGAFISLLLVANLCYLLRKGWCGGRR